jgi:competence protein ComEC
MVLSGMHSPRAPIVFVFVLTLSVVCTAAQTRAVKTLDIYVVDVEGGNATLFVSPSGEPLLLDSGNAGAAAIRDAERIMAAVKDARLDRIDTFVRPPEISMFGEPFE